MPHTEAGVAATGTGVRARPRAALPALCVTQITSWGILYYAFPVLNPAITADTGWSAGATTAAFSAALLVSALTGIYVGRVLDHRGPRLVMTAGSVLGVVSLLTVAAAPTSPSSPQGLCWPERRWPPPSTSLPSPPSPAGGPPTTSTP